jgi:2-aminoadipate transaminase
MAFDYSPLLSATVPAPAVRWAGFPRFNFIGGHNDSGAVPVEAFMEASQRVLAREGHNLATYGLASGPQGYRPLREFLASSLETRCGMRQTADDVLVVSGSLSKKPPIRARCSAMTGLVFSISGCRWMKTVSAWMPCPARSTG